MIRQPSAEQQQIIDAVIANQNVMCSSVAGAGKTTTVLFLAALLPNKNILQVTYNRALKLEVDAKRIKENLENLTIKTFNGLAYEYYSKIGFNDMGVRKIVTDNLPLLSEMSYDIIIIDESQDMTKVLFDLMKKYLRDMPQPDIPVILVVIGDHNQAVYEFKGADKRYLTLSNPIWFNNNYANLLLRTSYRVTNQIASFVNTFMLGQKRIIAMRDGPPIQYIIKNAYKGIVDIFNLIDAQLKDLNSQIYPGDIFILMPSVRCMKSKKSPAAMLENRLVLAGHSVFVPLSDDSQINDSITAGKILFSTFHQAKGRERKLVVIMGFDNSYFKYYARDANSAICPETLYVAATRAINQLIILDSSGQNGILPFMTQHRHIGHANVPFVNMIGYNSPAAATSAEMEFSKTSVVELVRHISTDILIEITNIIDGGEQLFERTLVNGAVTIPMMGEHCKEEVCDLTGVAIPMIHEYLAKKMVGCKILDDLKSAELYFKTINLDLSYNENPRDIKDFLRIATIYHFYNTGLLFKVKQIPTSYGWVTKEETVKFLKNMETVTIPAKYEMRIGNMIDENGCNYYSYVSDGREIRISGIVDLVNVDTLYEIKCVGEISIEHKLQLLVYCFIWIKSYNWRPDRKFKLLNIRTGECFTIILNEGNIAKIENILGLLVKNKYINKNKIDDEEFISNHR
jgi:nucleoside-triphosphatase THEP1